MAIKFGSDGTLYCNTVRYNYKQARNIVYNNCASHSTFSDGWTISSSVSNGTLADTVGSCFLFQQKSSTQPIIKQQCFQPTANHKYYGSLLFQSSSSFSCGDSRFEWWCNDTNLTGRLTFAYMQNVNTNNTWVRSSSIQTAGSSLSSGTWCIRFFTTNPSGATIQTQFIIVDLTDTFGSGNEPTQAWCDANILEYTKLSACDNTFSDSYSTSFTSSNVYSWNTLNSNWEPRDRMNYLVCDNSGFSYYISYNWGLSYTDVDNYYIGADVCDLNDNISLTSNPLCKRQHYLFYFPITSDRVYAIGSDGKAPISHTLTNGGGGMKFWKRIGNSGAIRTTSTSATSSFRIILYTNYDKFYLRICNPMIIKYSDFLTHYYYGFCYGKVNLDELKASAESILNANTFNRMLDARNNVIIHIKDPTKKYIKFKVPMQKVTRTITEITLANADAWAGLKGDSWSKCTNTSELTTGLAYMDFTLSDYNTPIRFVVDITSISGDMIYTNNLGWGYNNNLSNNAEYAPWWFFTEGYDIECNDIEIHPEIDYISFDKTGTIKCKKLVTNF